LRFLIDMPVTPQAAVSLQAAGHDAVHASTIGLSSASDVEILDRARAEGRVVVTADLDYPRLLAQQKASRPGIILFRGGSYTDREMSKLLKRVLSRPDTAALEGSITVVDKYRIRRRRLPVAE
jgi:predicted nuclease of predicted toxin-antitoxin system